MTNKKIKWPDGKDFAFTIFDDTDMTFVENGKPIYDFLEDLGFKTTKSVWPIAGNGQGRIGGATCEDPNYLSWVQDLQNKGFEIGFHNATNHTSPRKETKKALEQFETFFGTPPISMANHSDNKEGIYWGNYRMTGATNNFLYNVFTKFKNNKTFRGHIPDDELFWGDMCKEKIKYVRNFVYKDINTLKICPDMPYTDPTRPYVNYWYASSEGSNITAYNQTLSEQNQDQLEAEGGACIIYTHFASGFWENGKLNPRFKTLMERLSKKNGWFVPVSTLLDFLLSQKTDASISTKTLKKLERKWLLHKLRIGTC